MTLAARLPVVGKSESPQARDTFTEDPPCPFAVLQSDIGGKFFALNSCQPSQRRGQAESSMPTYLSRTFPAALVESAKRLDSIAFISSKLEIGKSQEFVKLSEFVIPLICATTLPLEELASDFE